jgi:hypothetical protein
VPLRRDGARRARISVSCRGPAPEHKDTAPTEETGDPCPLEVAFLDYVQEN